jgi:hypothetical protein
MNKLFLIAIVCAIFLLKDIPLHAQQFSIRLPHSSNVIVQGERIAEAEGSQYLSEEWIKGRITLNDGDIITPIDLRLNLYRNEIHYLEKGIEYSIPDPKIIKEIAIGDRIFIYGSFKKEKAISSGFFEILVKGKTELLVLHYITRKPAYYNEALSCGDKYDHLILGQRYFIKSGDSIVEHDKKGKKLIACLGEKRDLLRKKIEDENLSFKKMEDLVKIVNYVNALN